jgi:hypothetical protein
MSPRHQTKRIFGPYFASDYHNADLKGPNPADLIEKKVEKFFKTIFNRIISKIIKK